MISVRRKVTKVEVGTWNKLYFLIKMNVRHRVIWKIKRAIEFEFMETLKNKIKEQL